MLDNHPQDLVYILDDEENTSHVTQVPSWKILIADDDVEIHKSTRLVLENFEVDGYMLHFLHAYSSTETIACLADNPDVALILLDVIMDTDDAGLRVVETIRNQLQNSAVRIVLITGQPGNSSIPEESIIKLYDINDYKAKTELTRSKLITTVISSIRSYKQIQTITQTQTSLEQVLKSASALLEHRTVNSFSDAVIHNVSAMFDTPAHGMFCAPFDFDGVKSDQLKITGAVGCFSPYKNLDVADLTETDLYTLINQCYQTQKDQSNAQAVALYIQSKRYTAVVLIKTTRRLNQSNTHLFDVFFQNLSLGFENVTLMQKLHHSAFYDTLTGLPNRRYFKDIIQDNLNAPHGHQVVAILDIKHFSDVNEGLDEEVGNQLLSVVAKRIQSQFPAPTYIARIASDVFGLIGNEADLKPEKINSINSQPFNTQEHQLHIDFAFGLYRLFTHQGNAAAVLRRTFIALNQAKKDSVSNFAYYDTHMDDETTQRLALLRSLKEDFARRSLELWYQPQYALSSKKLIGVEALLRWQKEHNKFIEPCDFIPLAEYSGLIVEIGSWVIEQACQLLTELAELNIHDIRIAVNIAAPQFRNPNFVKSVTDCIEHYGIKPEMLELEITESMFMDDMLLIIKSLDTLKNYGVQLAIDDFGTGFSSLGYLQQLPLNRIKIDRSFIKDIDAQNGSVFAETIIQLGKILKLQSIAEGIETVAQESFMQKIGCDEVQGFMYSKPMPKADLIALLKKSYSE